jgi:hypothetical protein
MADSNVLAWTFRNEIPIPSDVTALLVANEQPLAAYQTVRDAAIFTDKRLIVKDAQGLTGKKIEIFSLPYKMINMWSSENAGVLDRDSEIELWTFAGHIKIKLGKGVDVRKIDNIIAQEVL